MEKALNKYITDSFDITVPASTSDEELQSLLAEKINSLILHNFPFLLRQLYRIDVSEQKLKIMLKEHSNTDAGKIIAALVIERQKEKINSREQHKSGTNNNDDDERW